MKAENRKSFLERFRGRVTENKIKDIDYAYDLTKEAHRRFKRRSGERYFEHPRAGCLILTDELGIYESDLIISFLLHDAGEDTPILGNVKQSYEKFKEIANYRLAKTFGKRVADNVLKLTKPSVDGKKFKSKKQAFKFYIGEMRKSDEAVFLKMIDRLHNLRSLSGDNHEKVKEQVKETEKVYLYVFGNIKGRKYRKSSKVVLDKINTEIRKLKSVIKE